MSSFWCKLKMAKKITLSRKYEKQAKPFQCQSLWSVKRALQQIDIKNVGERVSVEKNTKR